MSEPLELAVLKGFADILEGLGIVYAIGGSIASSAYGRVRFTEDADVMVEHFGNKAEQFVGLLKGSYYVSEQAIQQALLQRCSFNIIHIKSAFKIDVFVCKDDVFDRQMMVRRQMLKLSDSLDKLFALVSPEDIILLKLEWYKEGGCTSQRQWDDIAGVLEVQRDKLDFEYVKKWSAVLGINELLEKAMSESG